MRSRVPYWCGILLVAVAAGCTRDAHRSTSSPPATVAGSSAASATATEEPGSSSATPRTTPARGANGSGYVVADPKFDALPGAQARYGMLNGAAYEMELPDQWNGDLVLYAHGFVGNDPILFVQTPPLRAYFIQNGFAWAASSFAGSGYNPDQGLADTITLRGAFITQVGQPKRTYIDGTSMGGHVVVSAMEQRPELWDGGFSECGVVAGVEEFDYLTSFVAVAGYLTGTALLPVRDPATYRDQVQRKVLPALGARSAPTTAGREFEDVIKNLTGGARPWRHEGFLDRLSGNFDLAGSEDPAHPSLAGRSGTNLRMQYHGDSTLGIDDGALNARVTRVLADPTVRNEALHPDFAPRTGLLQAPLLTLHTTGDHFVPIGLELSYRRTVDAAGAGSLLVQRAIRRPDHCQFSQAELTRGFSDLVSWVEAGVTPAGDDLTKPDLRDAGRQFTSPLLSGDPGGE